MKVYSDGGARGNPGPAAIGFIVVEGGTIIHRFSKYIGEQTNNRAEYEAIIEALRWCLEKKFTGPLTCYLDSQLVVNQINGVFKVKNANIKNSFDQLFNLSRRFKKIQFKHIPREKNQEADSLVNAALDTHL